MRRLAPVLLAFCLYAAEPWQSKPFTDWSDKDINKILTNSPWARPVSVEGGASAAESFGRDRGQMPGGRSLDAATGPAVMAPGGGGARMPADTSTPIGDQSHSLVLTVIWQSALPVKQALVRRKYGEEAGISPVAKKILDDDSAYMIAVTGIPPTTAPQPKAAILAQTSLSSKNKELRPSDVILPPPGKGADIVFVFQKTTPITADDKDVEFVTKLGALNVKCRFRLKDMLLNGSLAL